MPSRVLPKRLVGRDTKAKHLPFSGLHMFSTIPLTEVAKTNESEVSSPKCGKMLGQVASTENVTGVYFNNTRLKGAMHPLQQPYSNKRMQRLAPFTSLGTPLMPAPVFPKKVVKIRTSQGPLKPSKGAGDPSLPTDVTKSIEGENTIRRRLNSMTNEEKLFLEATVALSTAKDHRSSNVRLNSQQ